MEMKRMPKFKFPYLIFQTRTDECFQVWIQNLQNSSGGFAYFKITSNRKPSVAYEGAKIRLRRNDRRLNIIRALMWFRSSR